MRLHVVVLVGQVLMRKFWNFASYSKKLRGRNKHKEIPIMQGMIGLFYTCLYMVSSWKDIPLCKGLP